MIVSLRNVLSANICSFSVGADDLRLLSNPIGGFGCFIDALKG